MAENFGTIKDKVADWLNRPDFADSGILADLVNVALRKLEMEYDFRGMLKRLSYDVIDNTYLFAAPSDYKHLANAWWQDIAGRRFPLDKDSERHARMVDPYPLATALDRPQRVSYVDQTNGSWVFQLTPAPVATGTFEVSYYAYSVPLVNDGDTNYLIANAWHVLLDGSMAEGAHYLKDTDGMKYWTDKRNADAIKFIASEKLEQQTGSFQHMGSPYAKTGYRR